MPVTLENKLAVSQKHEISALSFCLHKALTSNTVIFWVGVLYCYSSFTWVKEQIIWWMKDWRNNIHSMVTLFSVSLCLGGCMWVRASLREVRVQVVWPGGQLSDGALTLQHFTHTQWHTHTPYMKSWKCVENSAGLYVLLLLLLCCVSDHNYNLTTK